MPNPENNGLAKIQVTAAKGCDCTTETGLKKHYPPGIWTGIPRAQADQILAQGEGVELPYVPLDEGDGLA